MEEMAGRETELQKLADQARALKDEVQWKLIFRSPSFITLKSYMRPRRGFNGYQPLP